VFDPEYLSKRKTRNSQEKHDDVDDIRIDAVDDVLADDSEDEIVELDNESDDVIVEN
jgi:hypothetical protein